MALKLFDAVTTTGASASHPVRMKTRNHTVQFVITGSPTAVTLALEGSLDRSSWVSVADNVAAAGELTGTPGMFHVVDKPVRYVRLNLTILTGGTSPTVTALYEGETA